MLFKVGDNLLILTTAKYPFPEIVDEKFKWFADSTIGKWDFKSKPFMMTIINESELLISQLKDYCQSTFNVNCVVNKLPNDEGFILWLICPYKMYEFLNINNLINR